MLGWILNSITAVFVILKAVGVLTWPWIYVFIPTFIWIGLTIMIGLVVFLFLACGLVRPRSSRNFSLRSRF